MRIYSLALAWLCMTLLSWPALAQQRYTMHTGQVGIKGTSTMHDWTMTANEGIVSEASFELADGKLKALKALSFSVKVKSLKSEKDGLAKNAYNALSADKHDKISFVMTSAPALVPEGSGYRVSCIGNLTIAGNTRSISIDALCVVAADGSISCTGSKKMLMTDHKVEPPKMMLGAIKTGNEITVNYTLKMNKQAQP